MNTEIVQPPQLTNSRLLLLGASAVILCMSFIISAFAPFPLALAIILYGRSKGYLTGAIGVVASFFITSYIYQDLTLFVLFCCVLLFAVVIAEIVLRGWEPVKSLLVFGSGFILAVAAALGIYLKSNNLTAYQYTIQLIEKSSDKIAEQRRIIEQSADKDAIQVLQLLDRPDLIAKELLESFPGFFFVGVFLVLWFNMFLILKSRRLLLAGSDFIYTERHLLDFKVPFGFVFVLSAGLILATWGNDWGLHYSDVIGHTILKCLGVFYFFHGFGIMTDLLNFWGIMGIFRALIVFGVILTATYLVPIVGLLDNWFDFRKYLVKSKTED